jgi:hypothetical protein
VQRWRLVIAGEGNGGGGVSYFNQILGSLFRVAGGGLFLQCPLANTLIVSIQKVHIARN